MVGREILVLYRQCFLVLIQLWDIFLCHGLDDHVGGGRHRCNLALHASRTLSAGHSDVVGDVGGLVIFTSLGVVGG
jgi:hypothetical protein